MEERKQQKEVWDILYPGMEPTNNLSEQVIREHVLMLKIIGTFRSEGDAEYYQYIASVFATWRLQLIYPRQIHQHSYNTFK
jgi:hypothetical protein